MMRSDSRALPSAAFELSKIKEARNVRRRSGRRYRSKLEKYRAELVALYSVGASYPDLAFWLKSEKRLKVHPTSVMRYLRQLPEVECRNG